MESKTMIKYGLRVKGEQELLGFAYGVNEVTDLGSETFCMLNTDSDAPWLTSCREQALRVIHHSEPLLNSSYDFPHHSLVGKLEVVKVVMTLTIE